MDKIKCLINTFIEDNLYLRRVYGMRVWNIGEQGDVKLFWNVTNSRNLILSWTAGVQYALRREFQLFNCEKSKSLNKSTFNLKI